ncbi:MAG: hypothetical protein IKD85_01725 [Firmicutes bacterium]|nr:hypothetical protein [Bacillota bacterium]
MKIALIIILIILLLFLFGEFVLDILLGAFTIAAGAVGAGISAVLRRFGRRKNDPVKGDSE